MPRTIPRSNAALFHETTNEGQSSNGGFPVNLEDLYSRAMDRALGIEKVSLATIVDLHANVLEVYENSLWFAPVFSNIVDTAARAFAFYMDLQMTYLSLTLPHAKLGSEALSHFAAPCSTVARSGSQAQSAAEGAARNMDEAIGKANAA